MNIYNLVNWQNHSREYYFCSEANKCPLASFANDHLRDGTGTTVYTFPRAPPQRAEVYGSFPPHSKFSCRASVTVLSASSGSNTPARTLEFTMFWTLAT